MFQRQITDSITNGVNLLLLWLDEPEPILKALAIADLGLQYQRLGRRRQLKLQLDKLMQRNIAGHRGGHASFRQVLGPAMQRGVVSSDDQPQIDEKSLVLALISL